MQPEPLASVAGPPIFEAHVKQLGELLGGHDPIVVIPEPDDDWIRSLLERLLAEGNVDFVRSLDAAGRTERLTFDGTVRHRIEEVPVALPEFLGDAEVQHRVRMRRGEARACSVVWIRDVTDALREPRAFGRLKAVATRCVRERDRLRVLVTGDGALIPSAASHLAHLEALVRPTRSGRLAKDSSKFIRDVLDYAGARELDDTKVTSIEERLQGLEASSIRRILLRAARHPKPDLLAAVRQERNRTLSVGAIEVREVAPNIVMGGLDVLRAHLADLKALFDDDRSLSDEGRRTVRKVLPKGMLLVGLPGCGKSLAAEVAASMLSLPLLQLHAGRLMDRWLGSSEEKLETALATAQAAAPCILWIDEIEKAVGGLGSGEGGGTGSRMLGRLLTWMQDNKHGVYVIATANSLDSVPPELLRRGRFDDHFKLGRPKSWERREILEAKRNDYQCVVSSADLDWLVGKTDKFSGADIDALVREATKLSMLARRAPGASLQDFERVLTTFGSQAKDFGNAIGDLEAKLKKYEFRDASSEKGDVKPASIDRPAVVKPLHEVLRTLIDSTDRRLIRWPIPPGDGTPMFEVVTENGARVAKLGRGGALGVPPESVEAVYAISRDGERLRLNRTRQVAAGDTPDHAILSMAGDALRLTLGGETLLATSLRATLQQSLPPELWFMLGGEKAELVCSLNSVRSLETLTLALHGAGRARRATAHAQGWTIAEYRVSTEADQICLSPDVVFGEGATPDELTKRALIVGCTNGKTWVTTADYRGPVRRGSAKRQAPPEPGTQWECTFRRFGLRYTLRFEAKAGASATLTLGDDRNQGMFSGYVSVSGPEGREELTVHFEAAGQHSDTPKKIKFRKAGEFAARGADVVTLPLEMDLEDGAGLGPREVDFRRV